MVLIMKGIKGRKLDVASILIFTITTEILEHLLIFIVNKRTDT